MNDTQHTEGTHSWNQENMITQLKRLLNEEIKLTMSEQIMTLENIFTL